MSAESIAARQLNTMSGQKDKLVEDIKAVVTDAEDMLKQARASGAEGFSAVRGDLEDRLANSIVRLQEVQEEIRMRGRLAARATEEYVQDNPWKSMGYVAVAGLIVGMLLTRGR
jgi:ElaB/YqjD/DUF883 family membrane-anchored ribosome-binding protein